MAPRCARGHSPDEGFRIEGRKTWHEIQRDLFLAYQNLDRSHQGYGLRRVLCSP